MLRCVQLFAAAGTVTLQAPLSMRFSRREYWSGLPFPSPGELPDLGIEPRSPALRADFLLSDPRGKPTGPSGKSPDLYCLICKPVYLFVSLFIVLVCSVAQWCPTLCNPVDCSTPASLSFTIFESLLKLMSIELVMPSIISSSVVPFSCPQSFQAPGSFPVSWLFASDGQYIGASASASVLPMNIQN